MSLDKLRWFDQLQNVISSWLVGSADYTVLWRPWGPIIEMRGWRYSCNAGRTLFLLVPLFLPTYITHYGTPPFFSCHACLCARPCSRSLQGVFAVFGLLLQNNDSLLAHAAVIGNLYTSESITINFKLTSIFWQIGKMGIKARSQTWI